MPFMKRRTYHKRDRNFDFLDTGKLPTYFALNLETNEIYPTQSDEHSVHFCASKNRVFHCDRWCACQMTSEGFFMLDQHNSFYFPV